MKRGICVPHSQQQEAEAADLQKDAWMSKMWQIHEGNILQPPKGRRIFSCYSWRTSLTSWQNPA